MYSISSSESVRINIFLGKHNFINLARNSKTKGLSKADIFFPSFSSNFSLRKSKLSLFLPILP